MYMVLKQFPSSVIQLLNKVHFSKFLHKLLVNILNSSKEEKRYITTLNIVNSEHAGCTISHDYIKELYLSMLS